MFLMAEIRYVVLIHFKSKKSPKWCNLWVQITDMRKVQKPCAEMLMENFNSHEFKVLNFGMYAWFVIEIPFNALNVHIAKYK